MVRMSQWWKQNHILIDIHGNNGSMDGDPPAAYRYTEARLAKISGELLRDLDKTLFLGLQILMTVYLNQLFCQLNFLIY